MFSGSSSWAIYGRPSPVDDGDYAAISWYLAERQARLLAASWNAMQTAAEKLGVDPLELAESLADGGIAEIVEALEYTKGLIEIARNHFPKSMHNSDKFRLENTNATIFEILTLIPSKEAT